MEESYMKESYKSYQRCLAANSARKNSLTKKTTVIEVERKLASNQMDREERQLREHLKQMRIEHTKTTIGNGCRGKLYTFYLLSFKTFSRHKISVSSTLIFMYCKNSNIR